MGLYKAGGGQMTETALWTNSSPTSNFGNTTQTPYNVTLSESYTNFDYIKIAFRFSTSVTTSAEIIMPKDVLARSTSVSTFAIGMNSGSGNTRVRTGYATSNTTIGFLGCYQTTSSSQSVSSAYIIPTKISGLKL